MLVGNKTDLADKRYAAVLLDRSDYFFAARKHDLIYSWIYENINQLNFVTAC